MYYLYVCENLQHGIIKCNMCPFYIKGSKVIKCWELTDVEKLCIDMENLNLNVVDLLEIGMLNLSL